MYSFRVDHPLNDKSTSISWFVLLFSFIHFFVEVDEFSPENVLVVHKLTDPLNVLLIDRVVIFLEISLVRFLHQLFHFVTDSVFFQVVFPISPRVYENSLYFVGDTVGVTGTQRFEYIHNEGYQY